MKQSEPLKGYPDYYIKVIQKLKHQYNFEVSPDPIYSIIEKETAYLVNKATKEKKLLNKYIDFGYFTQEDIEEEAICLIEDRVFTRHLALKMK